MKRRVINIGGENVEIPAFDNKMILYAVVGVLLLFVVFSSVYEKYSSYLNKGEMIFVRGKVSETSENSFRMLCDEIIPISEVWHRFSNGLYLVINPKQIKDAVINKLQKLNQKHPGDMPLYFEMKTNGNSNGLIMRSNKFQVILTDEFLKELQKIIGEGNIQIK